MKECVIRTGRAFAVLQVTLMLSLAPSVAVASALIRALDRHPGRTGSSLLIWAGLALTGAALWPIGDRVIRTGGLTRVIAVSAAVVLTAWSFIRHALALLASGSLAERLMWLLDMEDNARFVGVAREMMAGSPSGGRLASQFGTGFMSPAVLALGVWRGVPAGDPRVAAIDATNLSVAIAVLMVALIVIMVSVTTMASMGVQHGLLRAVLEIPIVATAAATGIWVAVAVPMRSGFLSFIWGVIWASLAASLVPLFYQLVGWRRVLLLVPLCSTVALLIDSWPFLIAGLVTLLSVGSLRRTSRPNDWTSGRRVSYYGLLSAMLLTAAVLIWNSPVRSVLGSVGLAVLEVEGTSITTAPWMRVLAAAAVLLGLVAAFLGSTESGRDRIRVTAATSEASAAALWVSVAGLFLLALVLNEGSWGYAGRKLLHGAVAVSLLVALPALVARVIALRLPIAAGAAALAVLLSSAVLRFPEGWEEQVNAHLQPHALVITDAIRITSPELPIRCLPPEETAATSGARWAAYFCVNWVEDAFNADRFHGYQMDMLLHDGDDFDDLIDRMLTERASEYLFAHRIVAGPGWAHWDGVS